jgi:hypothetical protein
MRSKSRAFLLPNFGEKFGALLIPTLIFTYFYWEYVTIWDCPKIWAIILKENGGKSAMPCTRDDFVQVGYQFSWFFADVS